MLLAAKPKAWAASASAFPTTILTGHADRRPRRQQPLMDPWNVDPSAYAEARERRRTTSALASTIIVAAFAVGLGVRSGAMAGVLVALVVALLIGAIAGLLALADLLRRRGDSAKGLPRSWPCTLPAWVVPSVRSARPAAKPTNEILGYLSVGPGAITWRPTAQASKFYGVGPQSWDRSWTPTVTSAFGFSQQRLTLEKGDRGRVEIWVRHAKGLAQACTARGDV